MTARPPTVALQTQQRLTPRWLMLVAAGGAVAALVALFPGQALVTETLSQTKVDAVSLAYLQLLLRSRPGDAAIRVSLAQSLANLGRYEEARVTLQPLLGSGSSMQLQAQILAIELNLREAAALPIGDVRRAELFELSQIELARVPEDALDAQKAQRLADMGLPAALARSVPNDEATRVAGELNASAAAAIGLSKRGAHATPPLKVKGRAAARSADLLMTSAAAPEAAMLVDQAELALQSGDLDSMEQQLRRAISTPSPPPAMAYERLVAFHNARREPREAISVAMQAYARRAEPRWLLLAMDAASRADEWQELERLLVLAKQQPTVFQDSEMYWLLEAHLARHCADTSRARAAYDRALAINPSSMATRLQAIWFEVFAGDLPHLLALLEGGAEQARTEPSAWSAYASGLLRAGYADDSLKWFEMAFARGGEDLLWTAGYLDSVEQAGRPRQADTWRAALLHRMDDAWQARGSIDDARKAQFGRAYAALLGRLRGEDAEQHMLEELVFQAEADEATYERLIALSLKHHAFAAAGAWARQAERDRQRVPGYQKLALALQEGNVARVEALLSDNEAALGQSDRVTALRQLGRYTQALQVAQAALAEPTVPSRDLLLRHRDELQHLLARQVTPQLQLRSISGLRLDRYGLSGEVPLGDGRVLRAEAARVRVLPGGRAGFVASRPLDETEAAVQLLVPIAGQELTAALGRNERQQDSLTQVSLGLAHHSPSGLEIRVTASAHEIPFETSLLRAVGSKDRLSLYVAVPIAPGIHAGAETSVHQFQTRSGEHIADGKRLVAEVGASIPQDPRVKVRVSGSMENNQLEAAVPQSVAATIKPAPVSVESIVPRRFSTLGVGATWRSDSDVTARQPRALVDGWVGRQWPANKAAYSVRASMEVPMGRGNKLTVDASYSNVQSQTQAQASRSVAIQYRHEF